MITKKGKVVGVKNGKLLVAVDNVSACAGCHQRTACLLTDCKVKVLEIDVKNVSSYKEGQEVEVCLQENAAKLAIIFAFVLPLVLLIVSLWIFMIFMQNEIKSAVFSLILMFFYYFCLFLCKDKLAKKIRITIGD